MCVSATAVILNPWSTAVDHGLRITAVAETHIHADFLSGTRELARLLGAHVYISGEGGEDWNARWLEDLEHTELRDGDTFHIGGIMLTALHTPGPGCARRSA